MNVVGEQLYLPEDSISFTVTGVLADIPQNTHLRFDMLASFQTLYETERYVEGWWNFGTYTYVELNPLSDPKEVGEKNKTNITKLYRGSGRIKWILPGVLPAKS